MSGDTAATFCATLADEWVRLGVTHAVICPGSRSTPLALALAANDALTTLVHHDERAAAFLALGIGLATGRPAIVLTTSGTAAVELHPAVVEAHQAYVPLIAVTADRPPELHGVGAPQTIDQRRLFGGAVRWFVEPGPPDDRSRLGWRHLAADVWARTGGIPPGPVHLNLAFREPLVGDVGELPPVDPSVDRRRSPGFGLLGEQLGGLASMLRGRRVVIVAGVRSAIDAGEAAAVLELAERAGWPILADHQSGLRLDHPNVVTTFDPLLRHEDAADALRPEAVIRIGGLLASRVTNEWLARSGAAQIALDRWGSCPDPDHVVGASFTVEIVEACRQLRSLVADDAAPEDWTRRWQATEAAARRAIDDAVRGEAAVAIEALQGAAEGGALFVSSSMPVRDLEWYAPARPEVRVLSNRGANGIDGVVSTAVGVACSGTPTVCLVGDVAFLHDSNALLGLRARSADLAIVVVDNDGGGIFSFLPQAATLETDRFEQLFGTPHGVDLEVLTRAHGIDVSRVPDAAGVERSLAAWRASGGVRVIVMTSDRRANVEAHRQINAAVAEAVTNAVAEGV